MEPIKLATLTGAGMVAYRVPVGALLWGGADKEPITAGQVGALAGILAGVVLV